MKLFIVRGEQYVALTNPPKMFFCGVFLAFFDGHERQNLPKKPEILRGNCTVIFL